MKLPETVTLSPVAASAIAIMPALLRLPVIANVPETAFKVPPVLISRLFIVRALLLNAMVDPSLISTVSQLEKRVLLTLPEDPENFSISDVPAPPSNSVTPLKSPPAKFRLSTPSPRTILPATEAPVLTVVVLLPPLLKIPRPAVELTAPEFSVMVVVLFAAVMVRIP